jgi:hypothetical protein
MTDERAWGVFSCKPVQKRGMTVRGCGEVFVMTISTVAWDVCATIFFVKPAIRKRLERIVST